MRNFSSSPMSPRTICGAAAHGVLCLSCREKIHGKVLDAKAMEYVHYAVDAPATGMIDDLLTYSRIDTRARPFAPVDMNEALAIAMGDLRMMIDESGAEIIHEPLPEVIGDGQQIVILLENLISNAIKFRSAQPPRIEISAGPADGYWLFAVRDNGIGMEPGRRGGCSRCSYDCTPGTSTRAPASDWRYARRSSNDTAA